MKKSQNSSKYPWYFLWIIIFIYVLACFFSEQIFFSSIVFFIDIIIKIIPIFLMIFCLMVVIDYFINPKFILKHFKGSGIKMWIYFIIGGIISHGPMYLWYPLLSELKKKGISNGLIAIFLYNRAIKIPLLPLIILYFDLKYAIILTLVMIFMSIIQGIIINKLTKTYDNMEVIKHENNYKLKREGT